MLYFFFSLILRLPPSSTLFPYTTLFRSHLRRPVQARRLRRRAGRAGKARRVRTVPPRHRGRRRETDAARGRPPRSEEHTSELQSRRDLVCRLLLEKKKQKKYRAEARILP